MAWTAPFTAVAGAVYAASDWNTYGRDNLNLLKTSIADDGTLYPAETAGVRIGDDIRVCGDGSGNLLFQQNTGTPSTPTWVDRGKLTMSSGKLELEDEIVPGASL